MHLRRWLLVVLGLRSLLAPAQAAPPASHASGRGGAVAAGGSGAVAAGIEILAHGGNAADAAAAVMLALAVTDYGSFAIGGEVPLLIYDAKRREVKVLCGVGRAPLDPEAMRWYFENGIPSRGSMKAAPVPGAVDLCVTLLRLYGTLSFTAVVAPTLRLLDDGSEEWHRNLARTLRKLTGAELTATGSREDKLVAARDVFYRGEVADELEAWYIATGAFLRKRDLEAHSTVVEDPVSVPYRGFMVYKCGPWTQGPMLCQALRILEGFDLRGMGHSSADAVHATTEALKLALADRDEYYGDPAFVKVPIVELLSAEYALVRRPLIDMARASVQRRAGDPVGRKPLLSGALDEAASPRAAVPDTTTCVVADRWGNVVAATTSCNLLTNTPGPSGVNQGNRVRSLNTCRGHPNCVAPGKRPRVTLTPTIVTRDGKAVIAVSVAGGDLQDQTTLNVLTNHIDFGLPPDKAVTAPRFSTAHHQDSFDPAPDRKAAFVAPGSLELSADVPAATRAELERRGHKVSVVTRPIGHPVILVIDQATGIIHAAGDPAAGRHAGAIE